MNIPYPEKQNINTGKRKDQRKDGVKTGEDPEHWKRHKCDRLPGIAGNMGRWSEVRTRKLLGLCIYED